MLEVDTYNLRGMTSPDRNRSRLCHSARDGANSAEPVGMRRPDHCAISSVRKGKTSWRIFDGRIKLHEALPSVRVSVYIASFEPLHKLLALHFYSIRSLRASSIELRKPREFLRFSLKKFPKLESNNFRTYSTLPVAELSFSCQGKGSERGPGLSRTALRSCSCPPQ